MADLRTFRDTLLTTFSRLFTTTRDLGLQVDVSQQDDYLYLDVHLSHQDATYRLDNLGKIPQRIKIGSRYFKISQKNRQTVKHLAEWDPAFDAKRGFTFYEKDIPEILLYLRSKGATRFTDKAQQVKVDSRPLEYVHDVSATENSVQIKTALTDPDLTSRIDSKADANFLQGSKFIHTSSGFYRKPPEKEYAVLSSEPGVIGLTGDQIPLFLLYDLQKLRVETHSHIDPKVEKQRVVTGPFQPKVSLHVDGPWIWFDVRYEADRFKLPYSEIESLKMAQQFVRKEDTWIKVDSETHARVADQIGKIPELDRIEEHFRTPTRNYSEVQALLAAVATVDVSEAYAKFLQGLAEFSKIERLPMPDTFHGELREYQKHGHDWLCFLRKYGLNGILADEMGLGKTVQAIVCLLSAQSDTNTTPSLIVCPPSVLGAWEGDLFKFVSVLDFRVARYVGTSRSKVLSGLKHYDAILTTYTTVLNDIEDLSKIVWEYVILDEAQKIKNHATATAKACKRLIAKHKLALTGTPVENRLSELWSIYDFLMPSYLGSFTRFRDTFEIPIMKARSRKAAEELKKRIAPFKLRRLKSQVESELPAKIPLDRYCELTPEQVQLYKTFAASERDRISRLPGNTVKIDTSILTAILRLKQICCHPTLIKKDYDAIYHRSGKLETFVDILGEIAEGGEKGLIFSQFTEMLSMLRTVLDDRGLTYFYLDGSTPINQRSELVKRFQGGEASFFLISLRAGGLGMTLTEASCVVHYDRWWNPAVEDQATDRVHRIGQQKTVKVFRIHTLGTIEERIGELLVKKKDLFDSVIEVDDLRKEVSKEELLSLFAPPK